MRRSLRSPVRTFWRLSQRMLDPAALSRLKNRKNLLAFSGGTDSTALFYLLHDAKITFDIALVNYHTRPESTLEATTARELATQYTQHCFIHDVELAKNNFEHEARKVRYTFFKALIEQEGYDNLITAHQLDDRFEWLLMQLSKGAGVVELLGMYPLEEQGSYTLVRPLLRTSKKELIEYLTANGKRWSDDQSNLDEHYKRNYFRHHHSGPLLKKYPHGIKRSLDLIEEDIASLLIRPEVLKIDELYYFHTPRDRRSTLTTIDKTLKQSGFLMRHGDREALKEHDVVVVGRRYVVAIGVAFTFIAPYLDTKLEKSFKEVCRKLKIEPKLRPYLASATDAFNEVRRVLSSHE